MRIIGMKKAVVAAGFALALSAAAAPAHAVLIGASGTWTSVTSNSASFLNGVGTDTIAWGAQWNNRRYAAVPQSSYNFTGWNADLLLPTTATPLFFGLGAFTHNNQVIGGTSITQAILGLSVDIGGPSTSCTTPASNPWRPSPAPATKVSAFSARCWPGIYLWTIQSI